MGRRPWVIFTTTKEVSRYMDNKDKTAQRKYLILSLIHQCAKQKGVDAYSPVPCVRISSRCLKQIVEKYAGVVQELLTEGLKRNWFEREKCYDYCMTEELWNKYKNFRPTKGSPVERKFNKWKEKQKERKEKKSNWTGIDPKVKEISERSNKIVHNRLKERVNSGKENDQRIECRVTEDTYSVAKAGRMYLNSTNLPSEYRNKFVPGKELFKIDLKTANARILCPLLIIDSSVQRETRDEAYKFLKELRKPWFDLYSEIYPKHPREISKQWVNSWFNNCNIEPHNKTELWFKKNYPHIHHWVTENRGPNGLWEKLQEIECKLFRSVGGVTSEFVRRGGTFLIDLHDGVATTANEAHILVDALEHVVKHKLNGMMSLDDFDLNSIDLVGTVLGDRPNPSITLQEIAEPVIVGGKKIKYNHPTARAGPSPPL